MEAMPRIPRQKRKTPGTNAVADHNNNNDNNKHCRCRKNDALLGLCISVIMMTVVVPYFNSSDKTRRPGFRYLHAINDIANEHVVNLKLRGGFRLLFNDDDDNSTESSPSTDDDDHNSVFNKTSPILLPSDADVEKVAANFHNHSWYMIRSLINDTSLMVWRTQMAFLNFYKMWDGMGTLDGEHHKQRWRDPTQDLVMSYDLFNAYQDYTNEVLAKDKEGGNGSKPHVLLTRFYENWGAMSLDVPNRTWGVGDRYAATYNNGSHQVLDGYLNNDNLKAVFVSQHQSINHPKVHSIPLGTKSQREVLQVIQDTTQPVNKTQLLMINFNTGGNPYRQRLLPKILERFNNTGITNTYRKGGGGMDAFLKEAQKSKFVLCPSGVGWDTYRTWETLMMGSFPIVERQLSRADGYYKIFDDLPVLFVNNMETDLTPQLLETSYIQMIMTNEKKNTDGGGWTQRYYNYEKLTRWYWKDFIDSFRPSINHTKQRDRKD